jgi:hypothetical protein
MARFHHVAETLHDLIDSQQLSIVGAVFLLGRVELLGELCVGLLSVVDTLLQQGTHGGSGSGCASRVVHDKLVLHSSKALRSSVLQVIG